LRQAHEHDSSDNGIENAESMRHDPFHRTVLSSSDRNARFSRMLFEIGVFENSNTSSGECGNGSQQPARANAGDMPKRNRLLTECGAAPAVRVVGREAPSNHGTRTSASQVCLASAGTHSRDWVSCSLIMAGTMQRF
jgi:hypothetical protein